MGRRKGKAKSRLRPLKTNISLNTLFGIGVNLGINYTTNYEKRHIQKVFFVLFLFFCFFFFFLSVYLYNEFKISF